MLRLNVIVASTRPGRLGKPVAEWFQRVAIEHGGFDVHWTDLADFDLPVFDEPNHPRMQDYQHPHTRQWAASIDAADAYVLVAPEYNHGATPALLNALNYAYHEWGYKPAAFVSYGGASGGIRAVQVTKLTLTTLKVMPIVEQVTIPMARQHIEGDRFHANEQHAQSAVAMLDELHRWAEALRPMRVR